MLGPGRVWRHPAGVQSIAVDIDDTLNEFTRTLRTAAFAPGDFDPPPPGDFDRALAGVRAAVRHEGDLLVTPEAWFRFRVHLACYGRAPVREGAVEFMQGLRRDGWRIVICTKRDLRRSLEVTRAWLTGHGIPFDALFMAQNKVVFCRAWGIGHLVDDDPFTVVHGAGRGVAVYYPEQEGNPAQPSPAARRYRSFAELAGWLR